MAPTSKLQEEFTELMRFVAKKSKNAIQPMNISELCRQFKEETGTSVQFSNLALRINKYRCQILRMDEFDIETKARMMMAVWAPVDNGFLQELKKEADVDVDDHYRIIRYEKKTQSNDVANQRGGSDEASTSSKRRRDFETDTTEVNKRIRGGDEDSMTIGGHHIPQNIEEELYGPAEIDQKPANLFHNAPNIENNKQEDQDENRVPEGGAPEKPATSVGDHRPDEAVNLFQNASGAGHRLEPPIENDSDESEQNENVDLKPLIDTQGIDGSGPASDIHDQGNQERIDVEEKRKPSTSVRDLLILLRGTLLPLESSHLNGLRRKIEAKIQKLSNGKDLQFPLEIINMAFDPCLVLLIRHATSNPKEESTTLRSFLHFLHAATCHLVNPSMTPFHNKLIAQIAKLSAHDQKVPIRIVHNAMDAILNFIDS